MAETNSNNSKLRPKVGSFLRGTILTNEKVTRQFPFLIFLVFLGLVYITNGYRSEKVIREIGVLQDSVDDLRSRAITNAARLMQLSKPSEVFRKVDEADLGLQEQVRAPGKITVNKKRKK